MAVVAPRWEGVDCDQAATEGLAAARGVAPVVARLLCQRGFSDPEQASRFLNPSLDHLHDPMALADMGLAVDRVLGASDPDLRKERWAVTLASIAPIPLILGVAGLFGNVRGVIPEGVGTAAAAVTQLLVDRDRARDLGAAGRVRVAADFSWERNAAAIEELWGEAVRHGPAARRSS